jgi:hypothetical protein
MATISTLGDAHAAKWGIRLRCTRGHQRGIVKLDRCDFQAALDVQTLLCTRGRRFPLSQLASRLQCPNCGDGRLELLFDVPGTPIPAYVPQDRYRARAMNYGSAPP